MSTEVTSAEPVHLRAFSKSTGSSVHEDTGRNALVQPCCEYHQSLSSSSIVRLVPYATIRQYTTWCIWQAKPHTLFNLQMSFWRFSQFFGCCKLCSRASTTALKLRSFCFRMSSWAVSLWVWDCKNCTTSAPCANIFSAALIRSSSVDPLIMLPDCSLYKKNKVSIVPWIVRWLRISSPMRSVIHCSVREGAGICRMEELSMASRPSSIVLEFSSSSFFKCSFCFRSCSTSLRTLLTRFANISWTLSASDCLPCDVSLLRRNRSEYHPNEKKNNNKQ